MTCKELIDYDKTKRPHLAVRDKSTSLIWLVPCSSRIDKFEGIIKKKQSKHMSTDAIKIIDVQNKKTVLLLQDMFPVAPHYIHGQWIRGGQPVRVADPVMLSEMEQTANNTIKLLRNGAKFTPTQPDANRIEKLMLEEMQMQKIKERITERITPKKSSKDITR